VELVGTKKSINSIVRDNLAKNGEGNITVAAVANDLAISMSQIEGVSVRVMQLGVPKMVHPKDCYCVLLQRTPRLNH
jgi:hypothetical protein